MRGDPAIVAGTELKLILSIAMDILHRWNANLRITLDADVFVAIADISLRVDDAIVVTICCFIIAGVIVAFEDDAATESAAVAEDKIDVSSVFETAVITAVETAG